MQNPPTQREYWNSKVGEEWARQADRTDRMFAAITQAAFAALDLQAGESVFDIGCGAGATTLEAARRVGVGGRAVGVDVSRPLLELARARAQAAGASVAFIEADAGAADIPGAPFDAAFSRFGVMFFDDPAAAFTRIRAALRPGGRLVFISWRSFAENVWSSLPLEALTPILTAPLPPADPNKPGPFALSVRDKITKTLAGWRDISIAPWDGAMLVGGGGDVAEAAAFLLKIGPCARAVDEQGLDAGVAADLIAQRLAPHATPAGVALPAACWIVRAVA